MEIEKKQNKLCFEFKEDEEKVLKQLKNKINDTKLQELMVDPFIVSSKTILAATENGNNGGIQMLTLTSLGKRKMHPKISTSIYLT
jgi:HKD family nuclease